MVDKTGHADQSGRLRTARNVPAAVEPLCRWQFVGDLASLILRQVEAADAETVSGCGLGQSDRTGAGPWVTLVGRGVRAGSTW